MKTPIHSIFIFVVTVFISFASFAQASFASAQGQQGMENALKGVHSLPDLLRNPDKIEAYYQAVNEYYQGKIPRNIFDIILSQMSTVNAQSPELGERLLKPVTDLPSYELVSHFKTYGRNLDQYAWNKYSNNIFGTEKASAKSLDNARLALEEISQQINQFEQSLTGNKKDQGLHRAEFYKNLKDTHTKLVKTVVGSVFYNDPDIKSLKSGHDPDLILFIMDSLLKTQLSKMNFPTNTLSLLTSGIPKVSDLLTRTDLFPVAYMRNQRGEVVPKEPIKVASYKFATFARPLHAVWKGIWLGECVGGGNDKPTPRRWATVALENVNNYAAEKNGSFVGFIQELGMTKKGTKNIYYATEFGVPNLKEEFITANKQTGLPEKRPMIETWLTQVPRNIRRIKSDSTAINNAGVINSLKNAKNWTHRPDKGDASDFELTDQKYANVIIEVSEAKGLKPTYEYGNGMISDATVPYANRLRAIKNTQWTIESLAKILMISKYKLNELETALMANTDLVANYGVDNFVAQIYKRIAAKKPAVMAVIVGVFYKKNPDSKQAYLDRLLSIASTPEEKTIVAAQLMNQANLQQFVKSMTLSGAEAAEFFKSKMDLNYGVQEILDNTVRAKVLEEKLVDAYPVLAERRAKLLASSAVMSQFLSSLKSAIPVAPDAVHKSIAEFIPGFVFLGESVQLKLFNIYKESGRFEEFRAIMREQVNNAGNSMSLTKTYAGSLSPEILSALYMDAIHRKDIDVLQRSFNEQYSSNTLTKLTISLVGEIIKTKDKDLMRLLSLPLPMAAAGNLPVAKDLSLESEVWMKVMKDLKKSGASLNEHELSQRVLHDLSVAQDGASPAVPKQQTDSKAATLNKGDGKIAFTLAATLDTHAPVLQMVDVNNLIANLEQASGHDAVDTAQKAVENALGNSKAMSEANLQRIANYLRGVNNANFSDRTYNILAIFEIAAQQAHVPQEIYNLAKPLAKRVLTTPAFSMYAGVYSPLMAKKVQPVAMCSQIF